MRPEASAAADALYAAVLRAGEDRGRLRDLLLEAQPEEVLLVSLLRRSVPVQLLELLANTRPWNDRPLVLAQVVLHPRSPRGLSLRVLPQLYWRQLAEVAMTPHVPAAVRVKAESGLLEQLRDLRLGEKIALARVATPPVIARLLAESEVKVLAALLDNRRLREEDLLLALRGPDAPLSLVAVAAAHVRWRERYFVKVELALQPRTPLSVALLQLSSLVRRDLVRVKDAPGLRPLVRLAAERLLLRESPEGSGT